jgi:peptide/nickel transport system permease protein
MGAYILQRLVSTIPVLFLVSVGVFSLIHLTPGDPVTIMLGEERDQRIIDATRHELGLDQPIPIQYAAWLGRVLQGDLGKSIRSKQPVSELIAQRVLATTQLAVLSIILALLIAIPAGVLSAVKRGSALDVATTTVSLMGVAVPSFFLGILLIFLFSLKLRWLPPTGYVNPFVDPIASLKLMIMPALTLGAGAAAVITRIARSSLLEVLDQEYVRTARAKGLRETIVVRRHALRNALIPVVTVTGLSAGHLLGGAVIVEQVFALPGLGRLAVDNIFNRDFPVVQGVVLLLAVIFLAINFIVDLLYAALDPRIKYG